MKFAEHYASLGRNRKTRKKNETYETTMTINTNWGLGTGEGQMMARGRARAKASEMACVESYF